MVKNPRRMIEFLDKVKKYHWLAILIIILLSEVGIYFTVADKMMFLAYTIGVILLSIAAKYMIYLVLGFQLINPFCPRKVLKFFCWVFIFLISFALILTVTFSLLILTNVITLPDNQASPFVGWGVNSSALAGCLLFYRKLLVIEAEENNN
ncbi:hypothetical protein EOM82_09860 [bacterium]|nr:hypothetical protein [bacterium]